MATITPSPLQAESHQHSSIKSSLELLTQKKEVEIWSLILDQESSHRVAALHPRCEVEGWWCKVSMYTAGSKPWSLLSAEGCHFLQRPDPGLFDLQGFIPFQLYWQ